MADFASIIERLEKNISEDRDKMRMLEDKIRILENRLYNIETLPIVPGHVNNYNYITPEILYGYITEIVIVFNVPEYHWNVCFMVSKDRVAFKYTTSLNHSEYYTNLDSILILCKSVTKLRLKNYIPDFMPKTIKHTTSKHYYYLAGYKALFENIINVFPNIKMDDKDSEIVNSFLHLTFN